MLSDYLKTMPQFVAPKLTLTHFAGFMANVQIPLIKNALIRLFIQQYGVDMSEAKEENPEAYSTFNDFFIRHLKPECRPLAQADIVSPVDGFVSELGAIKKGQILQAKGRYYTVSELLACDAGLSKKFTQGCFATLYLSPKDYHRIHMPLDAKLVKMIYVPGKLFSVQPTTARVIPHLFARNERLVCFFETKAGPMAMVLVGATIVGAIGTRWQGDVKRSKHKRHIDFAEFNNSSILVKQGEEMGYFKLGSTVVLLFANSEQVHWLNHLRAGDKIRYGQAFGKIE
ncbi:archaetidylserine decarboxylase [Legionella micdadei]|uniref:Phosphatidylserine decarboxylase proenzyme n=1 Tax=Legionella micdadei TaxID=451 RepID=A0A098GLI3_LEGMI|nr:archaetidylserine decarboxylase [Legionella micdadei]ARG98760.1 phosphatidylserine decarboxylase [Legionella micdadei]ARH01479.1 phosphatidylserine decarboxylase [Legionella micdadei]KTD28983.1 phosphatidylserine decarboxylase [Legionella micdadei]NSL17194.1 phosphatidylserine decarboxylase [Legionella micdadei]CEG62366.1 Phosphatidylserine decarboxylase proenzyme [Legionella micdadei]